MAKYLLLGNGFDLHHRLPTRYIDVLNMFLFLEAETWENISSVGDILSAYLKKHQDDTMMQTFYQNHSEHLQSIKIDNAEISDTSKKIKSNCWFRYISQSYKTEMTWVDFEQIIEEVLQVFRRQFELDGKVDRDLPTPKGFSVKRRFFECFDNIYSFNSNWARHEYRPKFLVKKAYEEKDSLRIADIVDTLYLSLMQFQNLLCFYFEYFINKILPSVPPSSSLEFLSDVNFVLNLNYTTTYEKLYFTNDSTTTITYYHGKANEKNIVLGVNSSREDEHIDDKAPDTMFIKFKKFYQRIAQECDSEYIDFLTKRNYIESMYSENIHFQKYQQEHPDELVVLGHSLDVTDADIIISLFDICPYVSVYYHDKNAFSKYVINLTKIFGRSKFEKMRSCGKIKFVKLQDYNPKSKE